MATKSAADSLAPGKFPMGVNIRADGDSDVQTRPGYVAGFSTTAQVITDMKAYARLSTDNKPRLLVHERNGGVWLDDGTQKGTVGSGGSGASMVPFRPMTSPQSWMYVANGSGNMKFSAPDAANNVTAQKVGIAEPQAMPEASTDGFQFTEFTQYVNTSWIGFGSFNHPSGGPPFTAGQDITVLTRSTDSVGGIVQDPAWVGPPGTAPEFSVVVGNVPYQIGETLQFPGVTGLTVVEDVYPALSTVNLTIQGIYYFSGTTGRCVIVPSQLAVGGLVNPSEKTSPSTSVQQQPQVQLAALRRGSLLAIGSGATLEYIFVLSVTVGPQMQISIETSTTFNHVGGGVEPIVGLHAIRVSRVGTATLSPGLTAQQVNFAVDKGVGGIQTVNAFTPTTNPFNQILGAIGVPQEDDLIHISISVVQPEQVTELKLIFDIDDGSFTKNFLYFPISASVLEQAVKNQITQSVVQAQLANPSAIYQALINAGYSSILALTTLQQIETGQLELNYDPTSGKASVQTSRGQVVALNVPLLTGVGQYTELTIPIRSLTRVGNDQTKSLANCQKIQISCNVTATTAFGIGSLWVGGAYQLDSGTNGSPYYYRTIGRSSLTGARSNPSPATRYGILPHLQPAIVTLPSVSYDSQIDTIDIYRWGGAILSWRYIGSTVSTATTFLDNVLDSAADAGSELEFDNFEPWVSVDQPFTAAGFMGFTATVVGTVIALTGPSFPSTITRWLPGTLITLNGNWTYTLWTRPVAIAGGYLFRILENASVVTVSRLDINEPIVANQMTPYTWGPDAAGVVYGCGDPLKPGTFYSSKPNNPDASPNNAYDLTPPSEPLLGGEVVDGLALVASSHRWWQLQPAPGTPQGTLPVETPAGRGKAAPYGSCTDGKAIYFVAKDGIYTMLPGTVAIPLVDADIGNIFPHEGVLGENVPYGGKQLYAVNYQYAAWFRLSIVNALLRFHYYDMSGFLRILVLDMTLDGSGRPRMAWSIDEPHDNLSVSYQPEQPAGTLQATTATYNECYFGDSVGNVWIEQDLHNDNLTPISGWLFTPEWDGGDSRVNKKWMDGWVDVQPVSGMTILGISSGQGTGPTDTIPASVARQQVLNTLFSVTAPFLGIEFNWTDDFTRQSTWTKVYSWSNEFVPQPLMIKTWTSVPTGFGDMGVDGYFHIPRIRFAYMTEDANPVNLTLTFYDGYGGTNYALPPISMPGTSGDYQKTEFVLPPNKGLLVTFSGTAVGSGWAPILPDCEVLVGAWERTGPYLMSHTLGGVEAQ
jgi:hypothetical protein